jgi:glutathionylspermidine synthase
MIKQNNNDQFNPTYEEILEEFNAANSRLVLENIALKIRLSKVEDKDTLNRLDSYKLEAADKIITVDDYVKRKNLVKESV